jgi:RNA polymerase sigma factor (sigma-70 family)
MTYTTSNEEVGPFDLEREKALVERLKRKEPEAWKAFITTYRLRLQGKIGRSLSAAHLPQDCLDDIEQKTWLTAWLKIDGFTPLHPDSVFHWLCSIQRNHIRNLRRERVAVHIEESEGELPAHLHPHHTPSPESEVIHQENQREIWLAFEMALQTLTPREREIIAQRFILRTDVETLAAVYNVKVQTIYQIVANSKRKIRNYIQASDLFLRVHTDRTGKESKTWKK